MIAQGPIGAALALALAAAGVGSLRLAWRRPSAGAKTLAGWALMALAAGGWALGAGWDKAVALALLAPSLAGLALVCAGVELRPARTGRAPRPATELPGRSGQAAWRGWVRALCGGPLAGLAALALAAAFALKGPGSAAERASAALLLAPTLWALGLAWATTDTRLARVGGGLGALAVAGGLLARA